MIPLDLFDDPPPEAEARHTPLAPGRILGKFTGKGGILARERGKVATL